jgi:TPR repeat protein
MIRAMLGARLFLGSISAMTAAGLAFAQAPVELTPSAPAEHHRPGNSKSAHPGRKADVPGSGVATPNAHGKRGPQAPVDDAAMRHALLQQGRARAGLGPDLAYAAYQQFHFLTAFAAATQRVGEFADPKSMTLLAEIYANGEGVPHDDKKALSWYQLAADRGDREAMFALAMFRLQGRGAPRDRDAALVLLDKAAKLGHVAACYNLALLYLGGDEVGRDFGKAAELLRTASDAGSPEAQYALATLYKEGRGVPQDVIMAARLLGRAAAAGNLDAMVEFGIAQFNGTGVAKNESAAAEIFVKAARRGNPIAQNRLARILSAGRGMPVDPVAATKWHIISKAAGESDPSLDAFVGDLPPEQRQAGEKAAKIWLSSLPPPHT